jgi:hypothetical protein
LVSVAGHLAGLSPEHISAVLPIPTQSLGNEEVFSEGLSSPDLNMGMIYLDGTNGLSPILPGVGGTIDICTSTPSGDISKPHLPQNFFTTKALQELEESQRETKQRDRSQEVTPPEILKERTADPKRMRLDDDLEVMEADDKEATHSSEDELLLLGSDS